MNWMGEHMKDLNKPTILIVDDNTANLLVLEGILENIKVDIVRATSGNEALGLMLEYNFALILLDVQMPEMNGFEVAELMRISERTRDIPIIFVTAINKEQQYIFKGYEMGAVDYLFKPVEPEILRSKVKIFMELYHQKTLLKKQAIILEKKIQELIQVKRQLEHANKELEDISSIDYLTGIANRRRFINRLEQEWENCLKEDQLISIIMIDVDYFKAFNDHYGHIEGDECLRKIAQTLEMTVRRPRDFVARFGGEEFVVVLTNLSREEALEMAETIRRNVEQIKIPHSKSQVLDHVTISLGIATMFPIKESSPYELLIMADNALYQAKKMGRNRTINL